MKVTNHGPVPVYTISGSSTARPLPEWLARKRKRSLKQDPEYANRIELLQDFEFEEASSCIRISEDGDWVVSTGTYKPQLHVHYLPHLSISFARHTNVLNHSFRLLSSDYSKSIHLQTDRSLEFHTPQGCHHTTRIPRYGRDLLYDKRTAEALIPSVGVDPATQSGEVYRLNLELGRFMKSYAVDVGGDDFSSIGAGALQGGINTGSVNTGAIAEESHNLLAFGTSLGTVEFWDSRSRSRIGVLPPPRAFFDSINPSESGSTEITALEFHPSGLSLATGSSNGLIHLYDLRSPAPLLKKDQGYGYPIHTLNFLSSPSRSASEDSLVLSSDKRIIKIWDQNTGAPWTHVEAAVDLNCIAWCKDTGMILTANEGRQQHSFFIPQLGPAPRWCSFLDNLVEEMAEDASDPSAYNVGGALTTKAGEIYDNYKFVALSDLKALNLEDKIGTGLLKPYMHGYFMRRELYEEARILMQPELWAEQRQKRIQEKIEKEREGRIRGSKKAVTAKVNRQLAEKMLEREEKNERRKARRALRKEEAEKDHPDGQTLLTEPQNPTDPATRKGDKTALGVQGDTIPPTTSTESRLLNDPRFSSLFQDEDFAIDETSYEFRALNPSTKPISAGDGDDSRSRRSRGLTAVEEELADERRRRSSNSDVDSDDASDKGSGSDGDERNGPVTDADRQRKAWGGRQANANGNVEGGEVSYRRSDKQFKGKAAGRSSKQQQRFDQRKQRHRPGMEMHVSSTSNSSARPANGAMMKNRSFGDRVAKLGPDSTRDRRSTGRVVGEKEITFAPSTGMGSRKAREGQGEGRGGGGGRRHKDRRSASGNTMRSL